MANPTKGVTLQGHWSKARESAVRYSLRMKTHMTSFFPDLNVWLALSDPAHMHCSDAWDWLNPLREVRLIFSRYTQVGLLRLLTNPAVMGRETLTLGHAWDVYD